MHRLKYFVVMNAITEIMIRDKQSTSLSFFLLFLSLPLTGCVPNNRHCNFNSFSLEKKKSWACKSCFINYIVQMSKWCTCKITDIVLSTTEKGVCLLFYSVF
jgi:hypothetical protein